jgi:hypothetical protein
VHDPVVPEVLAATSAPSAAADLLYRGSRLGILNGTDAAARTAHPERQS